MMKLTLVLLVAMFAVAFSAKDFQSVELGFKSSAIEIEDGAMGHFEIPVTNMAYTFCNDTACYMEIKFNKHTAGEQTICISDTMETDCDNTMASYIEHLSVDSLEKTYCVSLTDMNMPSSIYVSILGKCKVDTSSFPCYSSTDADIAGVKMADGWGATTDFFECPADMFYTPFEIDSDGGNTAFYQVNDPSTLMSDDDGFTNNPSMYIELAAASDVYIVLDIDEIVESDYAIEFHYTQDFCCDSSDYCASNQDMCMWNYTTSATYVVYPEMNDHDAPEKGSYKTGAVALEAGNWFVTPYVYGMGTLDLDFRFCAGIDFECSAGVANVPSMFMLATLVAFIANYLN